jgi:excisionase family DNA binding protein
MSDPKSLTTREVARICRVSDATVKRWAESDLLKSERTTGGHRRFRAEEVARFQREQGLGLKHHHGDDSLPRFKKKRLDALKGKKSDNSLFNALVIGSEEQAAQEMIKYFLDGMPLSEIFDRLIATAMFEVGDRWTKGELSVTQEHLATRAAFAASQKLRNVLPVPKMNGKIAMCCTIEGDLHELPIYLAQLTLEHAGWEVINFGANTPLYALAEEVCVDPPNLVCISATLINDPERLYRDYKAFRDKAVRHKVPVILGGRALTDEKNRSRFPAEIYAENFSQINDFLKAS